MSTIDGGREPTETEEKEKHHKQAFLFCNFIAKRPKTAFGITLGGHILMVAINLILLATDYDILPVEFRAFPLELRGSETYKRDQAWQLKDEYEGRVRRFVVNATGPTWERGSVRDYLELYYRPRSGSNIFTKEILQEIQRIEYEIFSIQEYQTTFCQRDRLPNNSFVCIKPRSIIQFFDGTYRDIDPVFYDPSFNNVVNVLYNANNSILHDELQFFLSKKSSLTTSGSTADVTRSHLPMGWPLEGDGTSSQKNEKLDDFLQKKIKPKVHSQMNNAKLVHLNFISWKIFEYDVQRQAFYDMFLAIGSLCFIFGFMWFQTGSLWITGWAVLSIVTCFFAANLVYRVVLDYRYFGYFHIISIFIILGIGADDIFVFFNTWKATGFETFPSLAHRLSSCYRRAASTMFFTSLTTASAFLINGISPLLPIGSFGIFSGVLVIVNYISVIVFFPTVVMTYHLTFEGKMPCCVRLCKCKDKCKVQDMLKNTEMPSKKNILVRFFKGPYFRFVTNKWARVPVILCFLGLVAFFGWSSSRIDVDTEELRVYRPDTNYGTAWDLGNNAFLPSGDNFAEVYIVWGMKPRDISVCHFTDHRCDGEQVWDDGFDLNTPPAQLAMASLCERLKHGLNETMLSSLMIRRNNFTGELEVDCFMPDMHMYLLTHEHEISSRLGRNVSLDYPLTESNMHFFMEAYDPIFYNTAGLSNSFHRYFEIGVSNWLTNNYSMHVTDDFISYDNLLGEAQDPPHTKSVFTRAYYGTKLRYAAIRVNLTLATQGLNYVVGLPIRDRWEEFVKSQLADVPVALRNGFQTTENLWHYLLVQQSLVNNAITGIAIGLCIALPVLILATANLITGTFATFVICCITLSVMGMLPLVGWRLEVLVSMNLSLVVGLSVDYVVHMAEGYHLAQAQDRSGRTQDMLENLGISVLSGAITTLGAAFFMIFAKIQFFLQFGTFLMCTIGFSLLFSLGFFTFVIALIGPQNNIGSLKPPLQWVYYRIKGRKKEDIECESCRGRGFHKPKS